MHLISRNVHAVLDYVVGVLLIAAPWLFGISGQTTGSFVIVMAGIMALIYSLFTDYKLAIWRAIPFNAHLVLDLLSGVTLIATYFWTVSNETKWPWYSEW